MRPAIWLGASTILLALIAYAVNFSHGLEFSQEKGDWGTFGDFIGGFSNPILSFITMCMLIHSLRLQQEANDSLIDQNKQIKTTESLRSFESTFYSLAEVARQEYNRLKIPDKENRTLKESAAVSFIEEEILNTAQTNLRQCKTTDFNKLINMLDDQSSMTIFSCVRAFYILFKLTCDSCPATHRQQYLEICSYIMPMPLLRLVCIAKAYSDWEILDLLASNNFFDKSGLEEYLATWEKLKTY